MKRFFAMVMAVCMMGTTAFAEEAMSQEEPAYMSISRFGQIEYIFDKEKMDEFITLLDKSLEEKGETSGKEYRYKGNFYRIILHSAEEKEGILSPYVDNALKTYTIYDRPVVEVTTAEENGQEIWLSEEEQKILAEHVKGLLCEQFRYDQYFDFSMENPTALGVILNNRELTYFTDAYIDSDGKLYVSLEDWNTTFLKQYGNTKQVSYQNGKIHGEYQDMEITPVLRHGKIYLPLREMVNAFSIFALKWDSNLKKAVIYETWYDLPNER